MLLLESSGKHHIGQGVIGLFVKLFTVTNDNANAAIAGFLNAVRVMLLVLEILV